MKIGKTTGRKLSRLLLCLLLSSAAHAATDTAFTAEVDQKNIGIDDTVSLKLGLVTEGGASLSSPSFEAPDFDVVNSYDSSFVESYYDSSTGRFGMKNSQQVTKVLKPSRVGDLHISRIQIRVNGQVKTAPDIVVHVGSAGAGTPPPRSYGGGGVGLRGAGKPTADKVMLRAEVDKSRVYKGEQIVVSYYLYRRVRMVNVQVDKFPQLPGFFREELEMPVMQPRMDSESVVVDGVAYQRSLLTRYAAYPLQEGVLSLDPMAVKYTYYANSGMTDDGDDPIMNLFRSMAPREASVESPPVKIDVTPLPTDGRPASFSGGLGDFTVVSAVDKTQVRANEAVTLTIKIEGRGNVGAVGEPKIKWPSNVEVYDTKSSAKTARGGVGSKIFEILLIPRTPGEVTLPGSEFSFFDPAKKQYVTRTTEPIKITVTEAAAGGATGAAGNATSPAAPAAAVPSQATPTQPQEVRGLKLPSISSESFGGLPFWRIIYYLASLAIFVFVLIVGRDVVWQIRSRGAQVRVIRFRNQSKSWDRLRKMAKEATSATAGLPWLEVAKAYEILESLVFDTIDQAYQVGARSLPRSELKAILVDERGLDVSLWKSIDELLTFSEAVRFGGSGSLENQARSELDRWVTTAKDLSERIATRR
ncbi:MAG: BatD family protein [Oligoflexia bacterium]|nr:BatD family protein [Oligoflexia bacterium]